MARSSIASLAMAVTLVAPTVWAVDGVIEINQARVVHGGISAGDAAGFPATLSETGTYRSTGDLHLADEDETAIEITTADVTIDLNGFAIIGPVS